MQDETQRRRRIIEALHHGVVPAIGCTEPVSLALAAARAARLVGGVVEQVEVRASANLVKNAMAVTVPGTDLPGPAIAAALGAVCGDPEAGLEVLGRVAPGDVEQARALVDAGRVDVQLADGDELLRAEVAVHAGGRSARVCIAGGHTQVVREELDGRCLVERPAPAADEVDEHTRLLRSCTLREVHQAAMGVPLEQIAFLRRAAELNGELARRGLGEAPGLGVGARLQAAVESGLDAEGLRSRMVTRSAAAADARMGGVPLPAMTNSGSGNQGITATMPVVVAAQHVGADDEQLLRALALSHLVALRVHASLPVLSAFCAAASAGMGAAAGVCHLMGGGYEAVERAVQTMAGDTVGMVCDGASPGCALKVSSAVSSAHGAVVLALQGQRPAGTCGLVFDRVEDTIDGLGRMAGQGMAATDREILQIMMGKPDQA
ncbi:serine dehydratase subunit alpha family protein [Luteococcus sp.]|uniref:L-cysteine desulfidase family protein n=1 Tax=Luteococcus sp. TaxID=1969402 RepID=UPI0037360921